MDTCFCNETTIHTAVPFTRRCTLGYDAKSAFAVIGEALIVIELPSGSTKTYLLERRPEVDGYAMENYMSLSKERGIIIFISDSEIIILASTLDDDGMKLVLDPSMNVRNIPRSPENDCLLEMRVFNRDPNKLFNTRMLKGTSQYIGYYNNTWLFDKGPKGILHVKSDGCIARETTCRPGCGVPLYLYFRLKTLMGFQNVKGYLRIKTWILPETPKSLCEIVLDAVRRRPDLCIGHLPFHDDVKAGLEDFVRTVGDRVRGITRDEDVVKSCFHKMLSQPSNRL